jgi:hypothetical protein
MFLPGGRTGLAKQRTLPMAPLEWLRAHQLTKRWLSRATDINVAAAFITRSMIQLRPGFEGYIRHLLLVGGWNTAGNLGRNWAVLVDGSSPIEMSQRAGALLSQANFDLLPGGTDGVQTWVELDLWIPENGLVELTYNNNGGSSTDQIGGVMYGYYWPITLREEWQTRGWKK